MGLPVGKASAEDLVVWECKVTVSYIYSVSGQKIDFADPKPENIRLLDIMMGWQNTCRFSMQTDVMYGVSSHTLNLLALASQRYPNDIELQKAIFLHDASEAYTGDVARPLKALCPDFQAVEDRLTSAICEHFNFPVKMLYNDRVKSLDEELYPLECQNLKLCCGEMRPKTSFAFGCWPSTAVALLEWAFRLFPCAIYTLQSRPFAVAADYWFQFENDLDDDSHLLGRRDYDLAGCHFSVIASVTELDDINLIQNNSTVELFYKGKILGLVCTPVMKAIGLARLPNGPATLRLEIQKKS